MPAVVQDGANKLGAVDRFAVQAIVQRYSKDAPQRVVSDVAGDSTNYVDVPEAPDGVTATFEPDFSVIEQIEFPIGQQPPQYILDSDFRLYQTPAGWQVLLSFDTPSAQGDTLRMTWTARHAADGSTVPDKDFYAVVDYAASLALEALAAIYAQTGDPSISADVVNYRSKSQEYLGLAKAIRKRYYVHMGVSEEMEKGDEQGPVLASGNQYLEQNSGVDRLVHGKYSR